MTAWLVSVAPHPTPVDPDADLLAHWRSIGFAHPKDGSGDREDWTEQAVRLRVARGCLRDSDAVLTTDHVRFTDLWSNHGRGRPGPDAPRWGVVFKHEWGNDPADDYYQSETFRRYAGRRVAACGFNPDSGLGLRRAIDYAGRDAGEPVLVKALHKKGMWRLDGPDWRYPDGLHGHSIYIEGRPNSLLAQQVVDMRFEYRLFVVNGEPVTGAGCVENLTPLENTGDFDTVMQDRRGIDPASPQPAVMAKLRDFGAFVAAEWQAEQPDLRGYTLDVAMGPDGPLVVERNNLANSGLYASRPELVLQALASRATDQEVD